MPVKNFVSVDGLSGVPPEWGEGWKKAVEGDPLNLHYWCQYQLFYIYSANVRIWEELWEEFCSTFSLSPGGQISIHVVESVLIPVAAAHIRYAFHAGAKTVLSLMDPAQRKANPYTKWLWWYALHFELCSFYNDTAIPLAVDPEDPFGGPYFVTKWWAHLKPVRYLPARIVSVSDEAYEIYFWGPADNATLADLEQRPTKCPRAFWSSISRQNMASLSSLADFLNIKEDSFGELVEYKVEGKPLFRFFLFESTEKDMKHKIPGALEPPLTVREAPPGLSFEEKPR